MSAKVESHLKNAQVNIRHEPVEENTLDVGAATHEGYTTFESKSTQYDLRNMQRMGRTQQLVRHFKLMSSISFVAIATACWELNAFTVNQGLIGGGRAGLIWSFIWNFVGFLPIILSLAEMASMAPICGAQFHWVSEFAPPQYQKILSYFTGWFSTLAWQAGNAVGMFLTGTLIQTLILINNENYSFPNWHGTLLVIATCLLTLISNLYGSRLLPRAQNYLMIFHTSLYLCFLLPILIHAPKTSAKAVFTEFANFGGWPNMQLAILAGQLSGISAMTGLDTAAHISEEIKDAARNVPIAMLTAYFMNFFIFTVPLILALCFAMPDVEAALADLTTYPAIYVLRQTMSVACITALVAGIIILVYFSNVAYLAAVSRDLYAFARDRGIPFSKWTAKVDRKRHIPSNALIVSCTSSALLSLVYLGNSIAFYAIMSLFTVSMLQCYMFSIGSVLWRRIKAPDTLPYARWSLGRWGIPINTAALIYTIWSFFWAFWPQTYKPNAENFNWASAVFGSVLVISGLYYVVRGRHTYNGPVVLVEGKGLLQRVESPES